jgi:hypothetical protein
MSPRSSIGCVQNDSRAYGTFGANRATIMHQDLHYLQTDRHELPLELRHLRIPLRASKMISESMVHLVQTVHLYCTDTNTVSKRTKMRFHMTHPPRSSIGCVHDDIRAYGTFSANRAPRQEQHYLEMDQNEVPLEPRHLGVQSGASKMIYEPMVCSAQTMHLSRIKISTISKRTKMHFHLSLIT